MSLKGIPEGSQYVNVTVKYWGYIHTTSGGHIDVFYIYDVAFVSFIKDSTPTLISILSPQNNKQYFSPDVPLNFTLNEQVSQLSYSLDGQQRVTITGARAKKPTSADGKDAISPSSSGEPDKPSVKEILEYTRSRFVEGTQEDWIALAVEAGLSEKDANSLFERLKGSEIFWLDKPDGRTVWRWANG